MVQDAASRGSRRAPSRVIAEVVRAHARELSRTESLVADYLAGLPVDELPFVSTQSVAAASGVSEASVTRTARRLGFTGLPHLKREGSREHVREAPADEQLGRRMQAFDEGGPARAIEAAREALADTAEQLDPGQLRIAAAVLADAVQVWCVGVGTAGPAALHLCDLLGRNGVSARYTRSAGAQLASELVGLGAGDAVVLFHASRPVPETGGLLDAAAAVGARAVLVCGTQLPERDRADVAAVVTVVGSASRLVSWTAGATVIAELLALGAAGLAPERTASARRRLDTLRERF